MSSARWTHGEEEEEEEQKEERRGDREATQGASLAMLLLLLLLFSPPSNRPPTRRRLVPADRRLITVSKEGGRRGGGGGLFNFSLLSSTVNAVVSQTSRWKRVLVRTGRERGNEQNRFQVFSAPKSRLADQRRFSNKYKKQLQQQQEHAPLPCLLPQADMMRFVPPNPPCLMPSTKRAKEYRTVFSVPLTWRAKSIQQWSQNKTWTWTRKHAFSSLIRDRNPEARRCIRCRLCAR